MAIERSIFYKIRRKGQVIMHDIATPEFMSKLYFRYVLKRPLDLINPKTFNEKLQWLKLYHWANDPAAVQCADKYAVREYVSKLGKEEILNDLYYVWDDADKIVWDELPDRFVLKCNHGCGYNIICPDKSQLDRKHTIKLLKKWMKEDFSKFNEEPHYAKIPRKIICEKYLDGDVVNYNIYVINGKAAFLSVAGGLGDGKEEHLSYYNTDGSMASFKNKSYPTKKDLLSPLLPDMVSLAEYLGKDFPMVRVDLFDHKGKIILSELTFTPGGGLIPFEPAGTDERLGELLDISDLMEKRNTI